MQVKVIMIQKSSLKQQQKPSNSVHLRSFKLKISICSDVFVVIFSIHISRRHHLFISCGFVRFIDAQQAFETQKVEELHSLPLYCHLKLTKSWLQKRILSQKHLKSFHPKIGMLKMHLLHLVWIQHMPRAMTFKLNSIEFNECGIRTEPNRYVYHSFGALIDKLKLECLFCCIEQWMRLVECKGVENGLIYNSMCE